MSFSATSLKHLSRFSCARGVLPRNPDVPRSLVAIAVRRQRELRIFATSRFATQVGTTRRTARRLAVCAKRNDVTFITATYLRLQLVTSPRRGSRVWLVRSLNRSAGWNLEAPRLVFLVSGRPSPPSRCALVSAVSSYRYYRFRVRPVPVGKMKHG